jgi:hypothetical protein
LNDYQQLAKDPRAIALIVCHADLWSEPEFRFNLVLFNVNMGGLARRSFVGLEKEPEPSFSKDSRHRDS